MDTGRTGRRRQTQASELAGTDDSNVTADTAPEVVQEAQPVEDSGIRDEDEGPQSPIPNPQSTESPDLTVDGAPQERDAISPQVIMSEEAQPEDVTDRSALGAVEREAESPGDARLAAEPIEGRGEASTVVSDTGVEAEQNPQVEQVEPADAPAMAVEEGANEPSAAVGADSVPTEPLGQRAEAEREKLTPLPAQAIVDGRYVIQSCLYPSSERNLYRVAARQQQKCPTCGRLSPADAETCEKCGSTLDGTEPAEFYLMAESYRPDALVQDPELMKLNLYHPSLVPVVDFFEYRPFGHTRYYAIAEPRPGLRLSQMQMPRPPAQVLSWAMQLADALDYLHTRGVVGAGAESDDILVHDDHASLASLQNARSATGTEVEIMQQQSTDLARLAGTIYEAYTGHTPAMSPEGMLAMPAAAPEQIGAAFRAAIEPVQGAAPPISVAHWRRLLAQAVEALAELERPSRPVRFVSASCTDVGRLREQNQDSFGVIEFQQESDERAMNVGLYIVADGLGGHKGGEIASSLGVQAFCGEVLGRIMAPLVSATGDRNPPTNESILQAMTRAVQTANERIYKARNNRQNDMGTTLVAVLIAGGKAYVVNVGDSRLYLLARSNDETADASRDATRPLIKGTTPLEASAYLRRRSEEAAASGPLTAPEGTLTGHVIDRSSGYALSQISIDHSLVHRLVELGQLDPEEAKVHPHRNFIYRSLGGPPPVEIDTFVRTLHPGDRVLLCSDGLNSMIEDSDIESVLANEQDPHTACQKLIDMANEAGGHDNITALLVDVVDYLPFSE